MGVTVARWSKADTHCVVCQRSFATAAEEARHFERECEPERCWCIDYCWVNFGGDCIGDPFADMADDLELWMRVRTAEEQAERLGEALEEVTRVVMQEAENHRFGSRGYDATLDHLHDIAESCREALHPVETASEGASQ